jgi:hypothetical protein
VYSSSSCTPRAAHTAKVAPDSDSSGQRGSGLGPTIVCHVPRCNASWSIRRRTRGPRVPGGCREVHPHRDCHLGGPRSVDRILRGPQSRWPPVGRLHLVRRPLSHPPNEAGGNPVGEERSGPQPRPPSCSSRRRAPDCSRVTVDRFASRADLVTSPGTARDQPRPAAGAMWSLARA